MNKLALLAGMDKAFAVDVRFAEHAMVVLESIPAKDLYSGHKDTEATYTREPLADEAPRYEYRSREGAAIIHIGGPTMRKPTSAAQLFGGVVSTIETARAVRQAVSDPSVRRIVLVLDSPGGQVSGTAELAEQIRKACASKPVIAYVDGIAMSAGYWLASACDEIVANPYGSVGSIGVFAMIYDQSKAYEAGGVKPILISSGGIKGHGSSGLPISDALLAEIQREVDDRFLEFVGHVAAMRGMSEDEVLEVADGRAFTSIEGLSLGLVDRLSSFDDLLEGFRNQDQKPVTSVINKIFGKGSAPAAAETPDNAALEQEVAALAQAALAAHVTSALAIPSSQLDAAVADAAETVMLACLTADGENGVPQISGGKVVEGPATAAFRAMLSGLKPSNMLAEAIKSAGTEAYVVPSLDDKKAMQSEQDNAYIEAARAKNKKFIQNAKGVR